MYSAMVKLDKTNNVIDVTNALKLLFGKDHTIKNIVNNIGSNYGSKKVTALDNYLTCQDIVTANLNVSKIIGYQ